MLRKMSYASLFLALSLLAVQAEGQAVDEVETWLAREYLPALERILPIDRSPVNPRTGNSRVSLRVVPPGHRAEELETLIVIEERLDGSIQLTSVTPVGTSIRDQMQRLKTEHPEWNVDLVIAKLQLERRSRSPLGKAASRCIAQLLGSRVEIVPSLPMFVDATLYVVHGSSISGEVETTILGPGRNSPKQPDVLLKSIECVRAASRTTK